MAHDDDQPTMLPSGSLSVDPEYCSEHDAVNLAMVFNGVFVAFTLSFEDFSRMVADLAAFEIGLRVELGRPPASEDLPSPGRRGP